MTITRLAPGTLVNSLERNKVYAVYERETPEEAALKFWAKYGFQPSHIIVVGDAIWIEHSEWKGKLE